LRLKPNELGRLTFYELNKLIEGYNFRHEQEWFKLRWAIWHLGVLIRTDDYPSFNEFVKPAKQEAAKPMTNDEMYKQVEQLNKIFGGTFVAGGE